MRYLIRILIFLTFLSVIPFSSSIGTIVQEEVEYETGAGDAAISPRIVSLSEIRQAKAIPNEEDLHEDEWEYFQKEAFPLIGPPRFTERHSFSEDRSQTLAPMALNAPVLKSSFAGIPNVSAAQPDSIISVGPGHVMVAVNTEVAIYTKTGQKLFQTSFAEWFKSLDIQTNNLFDPKMLYDQYSGHFIFLCNARRADKRSFFLFSVSKTPDPTGAWAFWALDMGLNGTQRQDVLWADFPRLGIDEKAIYLTGNMTTFGSFLFKYAKVRILRKSQVYNFGKITWRDFWKMKDGTGFNAYSMEPVHSYGPAPQEYLVNTSPFTGRILTLWTLKGATTATPVLTKKAITVSSYQYPPPADQKGGGAKLATRECGVYNAVSRNGFIHTAHNVTNNWGGGPVSAIRYYQVSTAGQLVQEITYGADRMHFYYPVVMPDSKNNVFMGFNRSSTGTFAGAFFTGRKAGDPPGKFQQSGRLASGLANFKVVFSGSEIGRWGDYAGISIDTDDTVYFYGQYARAPFAWDTRVGILAYP